MIAPPVVLLPVNAAFPAYWLTVTVVPPVTLIAPAVSPVVVPPVEVTETFPAAAVVPPTVIVSTTLFLDTTVTSFPPSTTTVSIPAAPLVLFTLIFVVAAAVTLVLTPAAAVFDVVDKWVTPSNEVLSAVTAPPEIRSKISTFLTVAAVGKASVIAAASINFNVSTPFPPSIESATVHWVEELVAKNVSSLFVPVSVSTPVVKL